jgi:hypothetical protein
MTVMTFRNPQATMPLRVDMNVACNTPDDVILANVLANAQLHNKWVKREEPHDGIALICASGPSMADTWQDARDMQAHGATVFAMNGCAEFLSRKGMIADYQVIMDAREDNFSLIGPAKNHLFASQVHPSLFDAKPDAILWHATHGNVLVDEQDGFPKREDDYCLIGSSVTVGCTSLALVYAMGYRNIHVFGMDSCHRDGMGHAFHQGLNDDDPLTIVECDGKEYVASFTMKAQADAFMSRAHELKVSGCRLTLHGDGLLQAMYRNQPTEQEKYSAMWEHPEYRQVSPGENAAATFLSIANPPSGSIVADFGCGTGRGSLAIAELSDCQPFLIDFTENSRDTDAHSFPFLLADLTKPIPWTFDYGYCCDVMEHIHPAEVIQTIRNMMRSAKRVFFQISLVPDSMGALIGQPLHLTVATYEWWLELFTSLGYSVSWSKDEGSSAMFYIQPLGD